MGFFKKKSAKDLADELAGLRKKRIASEGEQKLRIQIRKEKSRISASGSGFLTNVGKGAKAFGSGLIKVSGELAKNQEANRKKGKGIENLF